MAERTFWRKWWQASPSAPLIVDPGMLQTEYTFVLPCGYVDAAGQVHRQGRMRLARALDEIEVAGDPRVRANEAVLPALLLSRVILSLGELPGVTPQVVVNLFAADLAFLEDLYQQINRASEPPDTTVCPCCGNTLLTNLTSGAPV